MRSLFPFALCLFGLGFFPLFGGPRYEAALLAGLIGPAWVLVSGALRTRARLLALRQEVSTDSVPRLFRTSELSREALSWAALHVIVLLSVALLHGVRVGPCEPLEGFALLLLGPGWGMIFSGWIAALLGTTSFLLFPARSRSMTIGVIAAALALPVGSALIEVQAFYSTPVLYAYDDFAGYFAGPLYDATEFELYRLLSFRMKTLGWCAALVGLSSLGQLAIDRDAAVRYRFLRRGERLDPRVLAGGGLVFAGLGLGGGISALGKELGHRTDAAFLRAELGRTTSRERCHVHFSQMVSGAEATRIARECEAHLDQLGRYFGFEFDRDVDVYLFANVEQKRRLIGAGRTNVAKPWRNEIYIRPQGFPHPVLGHELAHVVTAAFGSGPFRVAGTWGGLVPDPGRIEGFAEAAAVREGSEGTLKEWAAAMLADEKMPPLGRLFRLSFFGSSAVTSYTAAGAFVDFLRERNGPEALREWYAGSSLKSVSGADLQDLEAEFHESLRAVAVPEAVSNLAKPRFDRPGVFERRCPHAVDRKLGEAYAVCAYQAKKARRLIDEAVRLDPERAAAELYAPLCTYFSGDAESAERELVGLLGDEARYSPDERRGGWEALGDVRWRQQRISDARAAYEKAKELTAGRDARRQLDVKLWGLGRTQREQRALRDLLAPGPEPVELPVLSLSEWFHEGPHEEVAAYLLSRMALAAARDAEAAKYARLYEPRKLPLASLEKEAARTQLLIACTQRDKSERLSLWNSASKTYLSFSLSAAEALEAKRLEERCLDSVTQ